MIQWSCPSCEITIPMEESDFPVRCSCGYDSAQPEKIALSARAFSFTKAAIRHIVRGAPTADQDEIDHRFKVCRRCEFFTGSACMQCGCLVNSRRFLNKLAWKDQKCPIGRWESEPRFLPDWNGDIVDLVMIFPKDTSPMWIETRGGHVVDFLRANGINAVIALIGENTVEEIARVIRLTHPAILINRAFLVKAQVIKKLAEDFKDTMFVSVNHSSHAYTQTTNNWMRQQSETIELAQEVSNVIFGHVDERDIFAKMGLKRCLWFPNIVTDPGVELRAPSLDDPLVSLVGRWHLIKNQVQQMMALKLAGTRGLVVVKNNRKSAAGFAKSIGLDIEFHDWGSWSEWNQVISDRVAVGLQASFSESFNYIALEHLLQGRPVVGSTAVRYLPESWKADPDSPEDIARILREHLDNYEERSREAIDVASIIKQRNNNAILETLEGIRRMRR